MKWQPILFSFLLVITHLASAEADLAAGKASYGMCAACHGGNGEGITAMNAPSLTGQSAEYTARQLNHFKNGIRGGNSGDMYGSQMKGMAASLSEADITNISAYLASLPKTYPTDKSTGDLHQGNNSYQGKCGACHGGKAQGNNVIKAPALDGLDTAYFARQIANYKNGLRGTDASDTLGKQMKMMSTVIADENELNNIIAYIHSLNAQ